MKKIMFNDKYGLTAAVLNGQKTMTRRIIKAPRRTIEGKEVCGFAIHKTSDGVPYEVWLTGPDEESLCQLLPTYKVGEIVAVAQNYQDAIDGFNINDNIAGWGKLIANTQNGSVGYYNKMFTRADLMPHHIRITDIKVERLQDISDEDCLREGIYEHNALPNALGMDRYNFISYAYDATQDKHHKRWWFKTPKLAFTALIDKVSGKGIWDKNPWVFAYSFEKID